MGLEIENPGAAPTATGVQKLALASNNENSPPRCIAQDTRENLLTDLRSVVADIHMFRANIEDVGMSLKAGDISEAEALHVLRDIGAIPWLAKAGTANRTFLHHAILAYREVA